MTNVESQILRYIGIRWTAHRQIARDLGGSVELIAKLKDLVERRVVWRSFEASMHNGQLVMVTRYCLAHEVGDPPIGRRVRPSMMEMAE